MDLLFNRFDSHSARSSQKTRLLDELDRVDENRLLNTSPEELKKYYVDRFSLDVPVLQPENAQAEVEDTQVDARHHRSRFHFDDGNRPVYVSGTRITYFVPYEGDQELFGCRPSTFTYNPPRAEVTASEIRFVLETIEHNAEALKQQYESSLQTVQQWLGYLRQDMQEFNNSLPAVVEDRLQKRREKIIKDKGLSSALGVPVRRRDSSPQTYVAPVSRRKSPVPPTTRTGAGLPEPVLEEKEYEHILSIIRGMAHVLERSPNTFSGMDEEAIRQHFLVQLNAQYEGQATGETFNAAGKTDILVRSGDRNIFIAECKFWKGPGSFKGALEQLFSYTTWRDSKTALIVFNRERNLTTVLEKIPETIRKHPCFVRVISERPETTEFRYVFKRPDDPQRELQVTVLVFEMPK